MSDRRPDFNRWLDAYSIQSKSVRHKLGVKETYEKLAAHFARQGDGESVAAAWDELLWHQMGKPYFKIWPGMAWSLGECKIDIPGRFLRMPFECFEICLAKNPPMIFDNGASPLRALLVCEEKRPKATGVTKLAEAGDAKLIVDKKDRLANKFSGEGGTRLMIHYQFDADIAQKHQGWFFRMWVGDDEILENAVTRTYPKSVRYPGEWEPSETLIRRIVRMAIGVAFFGIGQHELVMPDIPRRFETRWHKAHAARDKSEAEKLLEKAKKLGHFGWRIGSEIDLPTPWIEHKTLEGHKPGGGYELSFGHIRRGHLRWQPKGKRDDPSYEFVFIQPTVVRPDLPLRDVRGFRIRDPQKQPAGASE